jgi:hypothetical protein
VAVRLYQTLFLTVVGLAVLTGSAVAGVQGGFVTVPGPIAGIGLSALAIIGGAYWVRRKLLSPKK